MAAPTDSGYGLGVNEDVKTVDIDEVKRQVPKVVIGEDTNGTEAEVEKNGTDGCPEGAGSDDYKEDEQVAKKARVEKAENGKEDGAGYGVESLEGVVDKDGEALNGSGEAEGEGEEVENGAGEEKETENEGVTGKDAAPGDGGLRTLLQEGDNGKTSVASHGADATHMLNGAK